MGVKAYYSTDASAPTLNASNGSLISVLKACLIDGYGSKTPPGGWTGVYNSDYTKALFKSTSSGSTGCELIINDNSAGCATGGAYESTSGFDGSGNVVGGTNYWANGYIAKSASGTRAWVCFADELFFYMMCQFSTMSSDSGIAHNCLAFGDFPSLKSPDPYKCLMIYDISNNLAQWHYYVTAFTHLPVSFRAGTTGHVICRPYTGLVGAVGFGRPWYGTNLNNNQSVAQYRASLYNTSGYNGIFPNGSDNSLILQPQIIVETNGNVRGYMPGVYDCPQYQPMTHKQTIAGTGALAGRTIQFIHFGTNAGGSVNGQYFDITGPWR